jgi:hypothetical protein
MPPIYDCGDPDCTECQRAFRQPKTARETTRTIYPNGYAIELRGTPYAVRCAATIAYDNIPDALWALQVLNQYGHLVEHEADAMMRV